MSWLVDDIMASICDQMSFYSKSILSAEDTWTTRVQVMDRAPDTKSKASDSTGVFETTTRLFPNRERSLSLRFTSHSQGKEIDVVCKIKGQDLLFGRLQWTVPWIVEALGDDYGQSNHLRKTTCGASLKTVLVVGSQRIMRRCVNKILFTRKQWRWNACIN